MPTTNLLALDVGEKRIGMAVADTAVKIPRLLPTLDNDDGLFANLSELVEKEQISQIIVGYPRNLAGETTAQTEIIEQFIDKLRSELDLPIYPQDESLTSVKAEKRLQERKKPYNRADIDAESAYIILQDYLEAL